MELGKATLRRRGINTLANAVRKNGDVLWTDGQAVYISFLQHSNTEIMQTETKSLGCFKDVVSVGWCQCVTRDIIYIVQKKSFILTELIELEGLTKQTTLKEISISLLPQGVLWNPVRQTLCLLSYTSLPVLIELTSLLTVSLCQEHNKVTSVTCGCWSLEGQRLYLAKSSCHIMVYEFAADKLEMKHNSTLSTKCAGNRPIAAMCSLAGDRLLCTSEKPVATVRHGDDSLQTISSDATPSVRIDSDDSKPQLNQLLQVSTNCNQSHLLLFDTKEMNLLDSVILQGFLDPDVLAVHPVMSSKVAVGSNASCGLQLFVVIGNKISSSRVIRLEENERLKGLAYYNATPQCSLLIMTGSSHHCSALSIPSTLFTDYQLCLKLEAVNTNEMCNKSEDLLSPLSSNNLKTANTEESALHTTDTTNKSHAQLRSQRLIMDLSGDNESSDELLETEQVSFNSVPSRFVNDLERLIYDTPSDKFPVSNSYSAVSRTSNVQLFNAAQTSDAIGNSATMCRQTTIATNMVATVSTSLTRAICPNTSGESVRSLTPCSECVEAVRGLRENVEREIEQLKLLLINIEDTIKKTEGTTGKCQSCTSIEGLGRDKTVRGLKRAEAPDVVELCVTQPTDKNEIRVRANFLLHEGRLKLDVVTKAFKLSAVRLWLDDNRTCYLQEDSQGYIPLLFCPDETFFITDT